VRLLLQCSDNPSAISLQARVVLVMVDSAFHRSKECIEVCLCQILVMHPSSPPLFHLHITHSNSFPVPHVIDNPSRAASQKHRSINDNFPLSQIFKKWANSPQGVAIIPLIMPGFEIKDYSHWLAQSLLQPIVKIIPNFGQKKFPITYTLYPKSSTLIQLQGDAWSNNHADIFTAED
jgi:hypothetical protein